MTDFLNENFKLLSPVDWLITKYNYFGVCFQKLICLSELKASDLFH